jgi:Cft2 family RNA processing exonuclease
MKILENICYLYAHYIHNAGVCLVSAYANYTKEEVYSFGGDVKNFHPVLCENEDLTTLK